MFVNDLSTEEGRISHIRHSGMLVLAGIWLLLSIAVGIGLFKLVVVNSFTPLQSHYFPQYLRSTLKANLLPFKSKSQYKCLVYAVMEGKEKRTGTYLCDELQLVPVLDKEGNIKRGKDG